jgi:hypothetical protein
MSNDRIGTCPFCKFEYVVTDDIRGAVVACPSPECGKEFTAGAAEAASSAPAETNVTSPVETTKTPPGATGGAKLRPMKEDDFHTVHPDELNAHISRSPILKTLAISLGLHVALILLLSIGNFAMCVKYKTFSVTGAVADHAEALKEEKASEQKAARAKAQAAQKAKREAATPKPAAGTETTSTERPETEKSAMERELLETSSERPTESSMSLDDMDDGL